MRILSETVEPGVLLLRFNRPEKRNSFDQAMRDALVEALDQAAADPDVRTIVLAGDEKAFVAGADLAEVARADAETMASGRLHHVWDRLDRFEKPIIMAVRGVALGAGCELALLADILIAADDARFGQPEIRVGIQPGAGGLNRMVRRIGWTRTQLLALTGEVISGVTAAAWGLAAEALPASQVLARAIALASHIAALPAVRVASIKQVLRAGQDQSLSEGLARERLAYWAAFGSADQVEGMAAFLEKRLPAFNQIVRR